jgi:mannose-6-phosphate isomerase-like protein (cupin superfamily)
MKPNHEDRPWGGFDVLCDQRNTKVKKLVVYPGQRLSLQSHCFRDEHWIVVQGKALATIGDQTVELTYGQQLFIMRGIKHRLACLGDVTLEVIEVQVGDDFAEDDIVRYEDDYQRDE